jgi:hypothetical protein
MVEHGEAEAVESYFETRARARRVGKNPTYAQGSPG